MALRLPIAQMPNPSDNAKVNSTGRMPNINPDSSVINANAMARYRGRATILLMICPYLSGVATDDFFDFGMSRKYPGTHSAENPNGIVNNVCNSGMFISEIRRNLI